MAGILCITGVLINAFIVAVNLLDWMKRKSISHVDQVITSLAMTRIFSQVSSFLYFLLTILLNHRLYLLLYVINKIAVFSGHLSTWLMTLLSIVFCLKISNFHHVFLLRLKAMMEKVAHLIGAPALMSLCYMSLFIWAEHIGAPESTMQNVSADGTGFPKRSVMIVLTFALGNSVPFILYCTSSVLAVASISLHIKRIKLNQMATINLGAYYNVIRYLVLSFLFFAVYGTACVTLIYYHYFHSLEVIWVYITIHFFPNVHSVYLIHKSNKLRKKLIWFFQYRTKCWIDQRSNDPRLETIMS
ncbi:hypothetical protein GDO81_028882 [Engystomops pustulosus]|uniref:Taste receptor type 2 n=1 Tax=Engystomops pustulosus TaxID=76066 RepID=A0AAV6ZLP5_ENGPU|nr:hypothetical protein GDO81_028882 [Engystomops pustulosus]